MEILGLTSGLFFGAVLLLIRISGLFVFAPIYSHPFMPRPVKAGAVLVLTGALALMGLVTPVAPPSTHWMAGLLVVRELMLGLSIGLVLSLIFSIVQYGGKVLGMQMGMGMARVLDPVSGDQLPVVATFYLFFALMLFLAIGGDRMMIEIFVDSLHRIPLGQFHLKTDIARAVTVLAGEIFSVGFRLAAPILVALFCTSVMLGIFARSVPQMNMLMLGFSLKIAVGLTMVGILLPQWTASVVKIIDRGVMAAKGILWMAAQ